MFEILIACERSQAVLSAILEHVDGHGSRYSVVSCDTQACTGERPDLHHQGDVLALINARNTPFDLVIGFPPCTHLAASGARWWPEKRRDGRQDAAITFFKALMNCSATHIALENPVGILSTVVRPPDQYVHPHFFGASEADRYTKKTGLWLKALPPLARTHWHDDATIDKKRIHHVPPGSERANIRSLTPPGLARAIATQWVAPLIP